MSDGKKPTVPETETASNFIRDFIDEDIANNKHDGRIHTRFPPEPNGYLHIGHAKSICLNFGVSRDYNGKCNLRFDDTNPVREDQEYIDSIKEDIRWLGFDWEDREYYASDYFEQLYDWAVELIGKGVAYVCELTAEQIREYRGTLTEPGKNSPFRDRPVEDNLDLFARMRAGDFEDGRMTLRAKIDMASPNMNMRDPIMYRIMRATHHRTGDKWCIYPTYDYTHGQSDSLEEITHSLCTLEFEDHRPLYEWYIQNLGIFPSRQIEFARLNLTYTVVSKRFLLRLVEEGRVRGWDDPRMPTISGIRRRGYPPEAVRAFCDRIGIAKKDSTVDYALLQFHLREVLNRDANRVMGVLDPLRVVITNYPEGQVEELEAVNNPGSEEAGTRLVPFSRELYIEREDFMEEPPKKFFRLAPGREVRLRYGYLVTCDEVVKDEAGNVAELRCTYDPATKGGNAPDGRRVKGTLHWVSAARALPVEVRLYDHLFTKENPYDVGEGEDYRANLSPDSEKINQVALVEPSLKDLSVGTTVQFERVGYFCLDADTTSERLVFNRTVTLRDTWAKISQKKQQKQQKKKRSRRRD
jgi:glutaminyl-tRNA synthetase